MYNCGTLSKITRQGVRDSIKRAEIQLLELEQQLKLVDRFKKIKSELEQIIQKAYEIEKINEKIYGSKDISLKVNEINSLTREIAEI
jgi:predicted DNA-binding protein YlxM (UPF0122 family)